MATSVGGQLTPLDDIRATTQMTRSKSLYMDDDIFDGYVDELFDAFEYLWKDSGSTQAFKKSVPVNVRITAVERDPLHHQLDPVLYTIVLEHGPYKWTIRRRYKHFARLDRDLHFYWLRCQFTRNRNLPLMRLPVRLGWQGAKKEQLERYLDQMLKIEIFRNHPAALDFLEVSRFSFFDDLGKTKGKEDFVRKHGGGYHVELNFFGCNCAGMCSYFCCPCISHSFKWKKRWMIIRDTFIMLIKQSTGRVCFVMLVDKEFTVMLLTSAAGVSHGLQLHNMSRDLLVQSWSDRQAREWFTAVERMRRFGPGCIWAQQQRYDSYAPVRKNAKAMWFVDAEDYYSAVADAINSAQYEIFIAGWWLSPELYLKRRLANMDKWRLDNLLKKKAEAGVQISILIYKDIPTALPINSQHTFDTLMSLHSNIMVLRHPDHGRQGIYYWGHHEKVVCIDQQVSFVGGLDLCYGRWDNPGHPLSDLPKRRAPVQSLRSSPQEGHDEVDGVEEEATGATHDRRVSFAEGDAAGETVNVDVPAASNAATPVTARRASSAKKRASEKVAKAWQRAWRSGWIARRSTSSELNVVPLTTYTPRALAREQSMADELTTVVESLTFGEACKLCPEPDSCHHHYDFPGQDYSNPLVVDFKDVQLPFVDIISRAGTPRLPWHDVHACVMGPAAGDIARHFLQRWNYCKYNKKARYIQRRRVQYLLPRTLPLPNVDWMDSSQLHECEVQLLRSAGEWSCGVQQESSILRAYCASIRNAQHFIYIENQFFISSQPGTNPPIHNPIVESLAERIIRAHESNTSFHCCVILPLLPGFPGKMNRGSGSKSGVAKKAILHYINTTISRGETSLFSLLHAGGVTSPEQYVTFYGLRRYERFHDSNLVTEMIYIHSKCMIVDDRIAIIGSANINDRSMTGDRDTEMAGIFTDTNMLPGRMCRKYFEVGSFAHSLRTSLFKEHLGCDYEDCRDPLDENFFQNVLRRRAKDNTEAFEKVFNCIPMDSVKDFDELESLNKAKSLKDTNPEEARELLESTVRGNLVLFPHQFLVNEDLRPPLGSKENLISLAVFT